MSAPQTDLEKQKRRHRGPLIGMAVVVAFGVTIITYWIMDEGATANNRQNPDPVTEQDGVEARGNTPPLSTPPAQDPPAQDPPAQNPPAQNPPAP